MPVYHFTIHAYRNWRPDHPRGYTKKGEGYKPSSKETADKYDERAAQDPVIFTDEIQRKILNLAHDICEQEEWRLEGAGFDPGHTHLAVSWRSFIEWEEVDRRLKNLLALKLNRWKATPGKRWFVRRHGAPRRVRGRVHFDYLLNEYFPDHPGIFWKHGMQLPSVE